MIANITEQSNLASSVPKVPQLDYTDGVVRIRRLELGDLDRDLEAKDSEQIKWLWEPGDRERWEAKTPDEQRLHALTTLTAARDSFGSGPKWSFAVDTADDPYVAYVDCDLANNHVPHGQANIAYSAHPSFRQKGYVVRAVQLVFTFLEEKTQALEAHINVDAENIASLHVARALGATQSEVWLNEHDREMIRFVVPLRPPEARSLLIQKPSKGLTK